MGGGGHGLFGRHAPAPSPLLNLGGGSGTSPLQYPSPCWLILLPWLTQSGKCSHMVSQGHVVSFLGASPLHSSRTGAIVTGLSRAPPPQFALPPGLLPPVGPSCSGVSRAWVGYHKAWLTTAVSTWPRETHKSWLVIPQCLLSPPLFSPAQIGTGGHQQVYYQVDSLWGMASQYPLLEVTALSP